MAKSKKSGTKSSSARSSAAGKSKRVAARKPSVPVKGKTIAKEALATKAAPPAAVATEAPSSKKWPKGGPTKADLKRYREKLVEMVKNLQASSSELATEALKSSGQDFSVDHMADHGSDNYEQDFSLSLLEGEAVQLTDIRDALAKIEGRVELPYGLCEGCADDPQNQCPTCPWIPSSRLDVVPHARLCVQMKEQEEKRRT